MDRSDGPVVVKLGGSFAFSPHLRAWIDALAACAGNVVIASGGGPFADAVRSAQPRMGFDDAAAHHMAVLAMEQYGRALASLDGTLSPADTIDAIRGRLADGLVPVWMPACLVLDATDIAQSWDVTSDSLAAWLAGEVGARGLLLVKHVEGRPGRACPAELAASRLLDGAFARYLRAAGVAAHILGPSDRDAAIAFIREGVPPGAPIELLATV